jgi:putative selenate reductase molybdopterin-binding subunit
VALTATALRDNILGFAGRYTEREPKACSLEGDSVVCGNRRIPLRDLQAAGTALGHRFEAKRKAYLSPRSVAFTVQGVRLAVHRVTGEIRILHSVHAADIGRLINPMQCRGQIEGAVGMAFGWALTENMVYDDHGAMVNPTLRNYRIPAFADMPQTDVFFADTYDTIGPLGAKAQGEGSINPAPRRSPTRLPMRPACASPICRSRPIASSRSWDSSRERCRTDSRRHVDTGQRGRDDRHANPGAPGMH